MSPNFASPAPSADLNRFRRKFKINQAVLILFILGLTFVMSACSLSSQPGSNYSAPLGTTNAKGDSKPDHTPQQMTVRPSTVSVAPGASVQFTASAHDLSSNHVLWSASGGTITRTGLFTASTSKAIHAFTVTATSVVDSSVYASATGVVTPSSSGGQPGPGPAPGGPPPGADNRYCDPGDVPRFGGPDGPASLPTACFYTSVTGTPSPGAVTQVPAGANLQNAINNANCGDTLVLQAGQTYAAFSLPAKGCTADHYITIRSSAVDSGLPAEGMRATPCNAGLSSLPGRPALACPSSSKVMATIAGTAGGNRIVSNADGANYYRLIGLEIADTGANGALGGYYDLVFLQNADHVILDRCWIHGSPLGEDVKGVEFEGSSYIAVIDSYVSDIHSKSSGFGADSSAIGSVTGTGPVKIVNNFLEAAGENILWGGGTSQANVTDVEIRRNHVFKPLTWWASSSSYLGTLFVVKNLFEQKSGVRELVEGNIFENDWLQAQVGTGVLFFPKNQYGGCPNCAVHDVAFRYNIVRHMASGMGFAVTYATTCPGQSGAGTGNCLYLSGPLYNISVHDNLLDDINESKYSPGNCCSGGALFGIITNQPINWPHDISIVHNTGFPIGSGTFNVTITAAPVTFANFNFSNNLVGTGDYGFHQVLPGGGLPGCAVVNGSGAIGTLNGCMGSAWTFSHNALIGSSAPVAGSPYPSTPNCGAGTDCTQFTASSWNSVGFVNFNNGNAGDYHLLSTSPYKNAGTDGGDIGADIDGLLTATGSVE